jgi:hypothetical protein
MPLAPAAPAWLHKRAPKQGKPAAPTASPAAAILEAIGEQYEVVIEPVVGIVAEGEAVFKYMRLQHGMALPPPEERVYI